jgi:hypothetical protein
MPDEHPILGDIGKRLAERLSTAPEMQKAREAARRAAQSAAARRNLEMSGMRMPEVLPPEDVQKAIAHLSEQQKKSEEKAEAELLQAGIRWIENKWGDQPCPYCQHVEWQVGTPLEINLSGEEFMSPAFPVMCGNCGHTTLVNAIRAGLLPEPGEEEE